MHFKHITKCADSIYHLMDWNLIRDDSGAFRVYRRPDGSTYESVTSFIGRIGDHSAIDEWRRSVGESEAARISKAAADKGTAIHDAANHLLNNRSNWSTIDMFYREDFMTLKKHLESTISEVFCTEHMMFSDKIKLAGTVDCIAVYDGEMSIIDFKTSKRIKYASEIESYFLQESAYAIMVAERYGLKIDRLVTPMIVDGDPKIKVYKEPMVKWAKQLIELRKLNGTIN